MRGNGLGATSSTGGTGDLILTAVRGLPLPSLALLDAMPCQYSIIEYADSTKQVEIKRESGLGVSLTTGPALSRSIPLDTWDGTSYVQSATPTKLSFGTNPANIDIFISDLANGGPTAFPVRANLSATFGPNDPCIPLNFVDLGDFTTITLSPNTAYVVAVWMPGGFPITNFGVKVATIAAGKMIALSLSAPDLATGGPGTTLLACSGVSVGVTGQVFGSVTSRLHVGGWYLFTCVSDGAPTLIGSQQMICSPFGALNASRTNRYLTRVMNYGAFGANSSSAMTGSYTTVNNAAAPIPIFK